MFQSQFLVLFSFFGKIVWKFKREILSNESLVQSIL